MLKRISIASIHSYICCSLVWLIRHSIHLLCTHLRRRYEFYDFCVLCSARPERTREYCHRMCTSRTQNTFCRSGTSFFGYDRWCTQMAWFQTYGPTSSCVLFLSCPHRVPLWWSINVRPLILEHFRWLQSRGITYKSCKLAYSDSSVCNEL